MYLVHDTRSWEGQTREQRRVQEEVQSYREERRRRRKTQEVERFLISSIAATSQFTSFPRYKEK